MSAPPQEPDQVWTGVITLLGIGFVVVTGLLVAISWWVVEVPAPARHPPSSPSPLESALFDRARGGTEIRAAGERRLEHYEWVDRAARLVRIPIDRAIDAVAAEPALIGPVPRQEAAR